MWEYLNPSAPRDKLSSTIIPWSVQTLLGERCSQGNCAVTGPVTTTLRTLEAWPKAASHPAHPLGHRHHKQAAQVRVSLELPTVALGATFKES